MDDHTNALTVRGPDQTPWYVVDHAPGITAAEIVAGRLRTANIPVFLSREAAANSAIPLSVGLLGGVDVAVPEAFYAEALLLLEGDETDLDELPPPTIDGPDEES
ncbi:MAG: DUF2007 domain-containing protein [Anaerolineae bacterium]|nr:DUF2007 domain-containing protein [Anaerolineae bacterium]